MTTDELQIRLHDLYESAGSPSSREVAQRAGISHTSVADTLRGDRVPPMGTFLSIVTALGGDPTEFEALWVQHEHDTPIPRRRANGNGRTSRTTQLLTDILAVLKEIQTALSEEKPQ